MHSLLRVLTRTALVCLAFASVVLAQTAVPAAPSRVTTVGRHIFVERSLTTGLRAPELFTIAGVCWNPTPKGRNNTPDWSNNYVRDLELMRAMNANTVRLYAPLPLNATGTAVMNKCYELGLYFIMPVPYSTTPNATVDYFKNHPALLMFEVGNETLRTQNSATTSGTLVVQDNWGASMFSTQWTIEPLHDDTYRIHNAHTFGIAGQKLPLRPASDSSAANIQLAQRAADGSAWQRWQILPSGGDGYLKFKNVQTGKVIRVKDGSTALGTPIVQFDDTGLDSSRWQLSR